MSGRDYSPPRRGGLGRAFSGRQPRELILPRRTSPVSPLSVHPPASGNPFASMQQVAIPESSDGFTPAQWSAIDALIARATETAVQKTRRELREEFAVQQHRQERERAQRASYGGDLGTERILPHLFESEYFGTHADAAYSRNPRRRDRTSLTGFHSEIGTERILPNLFPDELPPRPDRRRRSLSFRSPIRRPMRSKSLRDSIRSFSFIPPVDPYFTVVDDSVIEQEVANLERLIAKSWETPDDTTSLGRSSQSTLELMTPGDPAKAHQIEAQLPRRPSAAKNLPTGGRLAILAVCICMAVFLQALDTTIISTAIPKITKQFHSLEDVGWYGSGYFLTTCACQLIWGRIYTFYNLKYAYLCSITIFEIGSLVCGVAPNSITLIVGRAISGLGSAGIFAGSFIIIAFSVPPVSRPKYSALLGSMYGVASVVGPLVGGVFSDKATWRWCFFINLPLGAIAIVGILFMLKQPAQNAALRNLPPKEKFKRLDYHGTLVFIGTLVCLFIALEWGGGKYSWQSARIIVLLIFFGLGAIAWVGVQAWKGESGTVPFRIVRRRSIWTAAFSCYCMGGAFFILLYFISIYFQSIKAATPLKSGIDSLPTLLGLTLGMTIAGHTHKFVQYHAVYMITSAVLATIGTGLISTWKPDTNHSAWIGYQALFGIGQGLGWQQPLLIAQTFLETKDIPIGTALMSGIKLFGGATFISVGSAVFNNRLHVLLVQIPNLDIDALLAAGASGLRDAVQDPATLAQVLNAYDESLRMVFHISVVLSCLAVVGAVGVEWKKGPETKGSPPGPPGAPGGNPAGGPPAQ